MKKILIILALFLVTGFYMPPKKRYFFVGFASSLGEEGGRFINTNTGEFISITDARSLITKEIGGTIAITGLYEFQTYKDFEQAQE